MDLDVDPASEEHLELTPAIGVDHDSRETDLQPRRFSPLKRRTQPRMSFGGPSMRRKSLGIFGCGEI